MLFFNAIKPENSFQRLRGHNRCLLAVDSNPIVVDENVSEHQGLDLRHTETVDRNPVGQFLHQRRINSLHPCVVVAVGCVHQGSTPGNAGRIPGGAPHWCTDCSNHSTRLLPAPGIGSPCPQQCRYPAPSSCCTSCIGTATSSNYKTMNDVSPRLQRGWKLPSRYQTHSVFDMDYRIPQRFMRV